MNNIVLKKYYEKIIFTLYDHLIFLLNNKTFFSKIINTPHVIFIFHSYVKINNYLPLLEYILDYEIKKDSILIFRESTYYIKAITTFINTPCILKKYYKILESKLNDLLKIKQLIILFYDNLNNSNISIVIDLIKKYCKKYNKHHLAIIIPFIITKILIPIILKCTTQYSIIKLLNNIVSTIVNEFLIQNNNFYIKIEHISLLNYSKEYGHIDHINIDTCCYINDYDQYYTNYDDIIDIKNIILNKTENITLNNFVMHKNNYDIKNIIYCCKFISNLDDTKDYYIHKIFSLTKIYESIY